MKHWFAALAVLVGLYGLVPVAGARTDAAAPMLAGAEAPKEGKAKKKKKLSDAQVRQILIDESIAAYSGNCPCPYNRASNGSRCGKRSAYNRAGGEAPLCFAQDVSAEMVQAYRDANQDG
jgi:hypothetical protein